MDNIDHFILTRFDYPDGIDIQERIRLFRRYTLPSIAGQTNQDFTWLIKTRLDLQELGVTMPNARAIKTLGDFSQFVRQPFVLTSRIDNDDAVGLKWVEVLHNWVEPSCRNLPYFFDFAGLAIRDGQPTFYHCSKYKEKASPFVTCLEFAEQAKGVFQRNHTLLHEVGVVEKHPSPMWLQVVHGGNMHNTLSSRATPAPQDAALELFSHCQ